MLKGIVRGFRKLWYKLVTLKSSPRKIAAGFALGIFVSYTPTFGFQVVLSLALAALLRVNPIAAVLSVQLTNLFTVFPIYAACYGLGRSILGGRSFVGTEVFESFWAFIKAGPVVMATEFVGGLVFGIVTAVPSYFLVLFGVIRYRRARLNRRIRAMEKRMAEGRSEDAQAGGHR